MTTAEEFALFRSDYRKWLRVYIAPGIADYLAELKGNAKREFWDGCCAQMKTALKELAQERKAA